MKKNAKLLAWGGLAIFFCVCFALGWKQSERELGGIIPVDAPSITDDTSAQPIIAAPLRLSPQPAEPIELKAAAAEPSKTPNEPGAKNVASLSSTGRDSPAEPSGVVEQSEPQPLPVSVHIRRLAEQSSDEGEVRNGASTALSLTVREVDTAQQFIAQAQIQLPWNEHKKFGIEDGLPMRSGDKLIVASPSYREGVFSVP